MCLNLTVLKRAVNFTSFVITFYGSFLWSSGLERITFVYNHINRIKAILIIDKFAIYQNVRQQINIMYLDDSKCSFQGNLHNNYELISIGVFILPGSDNFYLFPSEYSE